MKQYILIIMGALALCAPLAAQNLAGTSVENLRMERNGNYMVVDMDVDLSALQVESRRAVLITPRIVNGTDSLSLAAIGVYGRDRYYHYVRNGESMLSGKDEWTYRASAKPRRVAYHTIVPYAEWMNGSSLKLHREDYGCCHTLLAEQTGIFGGYREEGPFVPQLAYVRPVAQGEKRDSLCGSAFIDFPVNKTVIYPDYRRNTVELARIKNTIDSVRNDRDITITSIWLKGYASPESPYSHNTKLAVGRTEALKKHINGLYHFADQVILTDYEPEDWAGLRRYVEQSHLAHRADILTLIDASMDPDAKEAQIKKNYPDEYRYLLANCYPALRHTDYRISYTIRRFSDVDEIKRIMKTHPQKLSLNEFYLAAQTYEPGSEEFNDVFETAVRIYPADETANLNAANTALQRGDLKAAERYLAKSGQSPEAAYARGAHALLSGNYDAALRYMQQAKAGNIGQADEAIQRIQRESKN